MIVSQDKGETIGFICWTEHTFGNMMYVDLDIMAIKPKYRSKGFGRRLYNLAEKYFIKRGSVVVKLFCSPIESEPFWKKMRFQKYPDTGYAEHHLTYYKPLVEHNRSALDLTPHRLELWNVESYRASDFEPKWTWNIGSNFKSIIQPCNSDWKLRLVLNNEIVKEDKVKYFTSKYHELEIGSFLYINRKMLDQIKANFSTIHTQIHT